MKISRVSLYVPVNEINLGSIPNGISIDIIKDNNERSHDDNHTPPCTLIVKMDLDVTSALVAAIWIVKTFGPIPTACFHRNGCCLPMYDYHSAMLIESEIKDRVGDEMLSH